MKKIGWWDRLGLMSGLKAGLKLMDQAGSGTNIFKAEYKLGDESFVMIIARRNRVETLNERYKDLFEGGQIDYSTHVD